MAALNYMPAVKGYITRPVVLLKIVYEDMLTELEIVLTVASLFAKPPSVISK